MFPENQDQRDSAMIWPSVFLFVAVMAAPFGFGLFGNAVVAQVLSGLFFLLGIVALFLRYLASKPPR